MSTNKELLHEEQVFSKIYVIRNQKVLPDEDLAVMYGVSTRVLNQAVKRNIDRFPDDFMFQLTENEYSNLMSQFVTSSLNTTEPAWGGRRKLPLAFTEQGVSMLSGVLKSKQAVAINIQIMRVFVKMRKLISEYKELLEKIEFLESNQVDHDKRITNIYNIIKELLEPIYRDKKPIGFQLPGVADNKPEERN